MSLSSYLVATAGLASSALAHSHISYVIANGDLYNGFDPRTGGVPPAVDRVVWSHNAPDDGWINSADYRTAGNIACHRDGKSVAAHVPIRAGDKLHVHWNGWPLNHAGPVLSYLAACVGTADGCGSANPATLRWTKIDNSNPVLISPDGPSPGLWATNVLIGNNNTWLVHVPSGLRPGAYVLRHEIIALHYAAQPALSGAQHYPICMNLWVLPPAAGTATLPFTLGSGTPATQLYTSNHPGLTIDINQPLSTYVVPGPTLAANAQPVPHAQQTESAVAKQGVPVRVSGTKTVPFVAKRTAEAFVV